jgi:hypothetical protein
MALVIPATTVPSATAADQVIGHAFAALVVRVTAVEKRPISTPGTTVIVPGEPGTLALETVPATAGETSFTLESPAVPPLLVLINGQAQKPTYDYIPVLTGPHVTGFTWNNADFSLASSDTIQAQYVLA